MWHYSMDRGRIPSTKRVKRKLQEGKGNGMPNTRWRLGKKKMKKRKEQKSDSEYIAMICGILLIVGIMILGATCN